MMRSILKIFSLVAFSGWTSIAAADLYRWVDPETGSVKFSSDPPPWYGDPAKERRAPKVERIPSPQSAPAAESKPAAEPKPAAVRKPETLRKPEADAKTGKPSGER